MCLYIKICSTKDKYCFKTLKKIKTFKICLLYMKCLKIYQKKLHKYITKQDFKLLNSLQIIYKRCISQVINYDKPGYLRQEIDKLINLLLL